ncbi:hypothetical protein G7043_20410 [Lentzea sp. NEAU-D13]|uniref:Uncharacterized protein n=1 Tax=Lentzea alba TaxID=2714351 RepID=A0A7C9VRR4_9PSEU|nr:hypothetical protein [Lentzea alba]NGY61292.1 hypothetical protein [Lentzea alba]
MRNEGGGSWRKLNRYRMAEGVEIVRGQGDRVELKVSMPGDEHGFFGRQCPSCDQVFRVSMIDYEKLPDDLFLWCVYCGHHCEHSEFMTQQQKDRALQAVTDLSVQMVDHMFAEVFGRGSRSRRSGSGIEIRYRSKPFYPRPLPGIDEERLVRERKCVDCSLRYAVFGEHRFCPVCGVLPSDVVSTDALAAETARLDGLAQLPADAVATLREQGVFTRIWVDTLENLVGIVETLASAVFRAAVVDAATRLNGKGNIFQRLDDTADLFVAAGHADLRAVLDTSTWRRLGESWAARHVFTHNDGVIDARYLARVPSSTARIGQRLTITEASCRQAIVDVDALCRALTALT